MRPACFSLVKRIACFFVLFVGVSATAQTEILLFSFPAGSATYAGLVQGANGRLYGANVTGGPAHVGQVFELAPSTAGHWNRKVLHSFHGPDGKWPIAELIMDAAGNLFGITESAGPAGAGTVFELSPDGLGNWGGRILYNFTAPNDPTNAISTLLMDTQGNLYGAGQIGGTLGGGAVFQLAAGTWAETVLHNFDFAVEGGQPLAGVVMDTQGNLYGTTSVGSTFNCGSVYQLTQSGGVWTPHVIYEFAGGDDGCTTFGTLTIDPQGNLFGTTRGGGTSNFGIAYEISPGSGGSWIKTTLYNFKGGTDGRWPIGGVILDTQGNLFGTTQFGGGGGKCPDPFNPPRNVFCGTVFKLSPVAGGWQETILHSFADRHEGDGAEPTGRLLLDVQGNIFGTTQYGGFEGGGTAFEITR